MPTGKNTPFISTLLGLLLLFTLFTGSPQMHGAWIVSDFYSKLTCHFYHANLFHFLCNAFCLWVMRPSPTQIIQAYTLSIFAMFFAFEPTIGFSAVLYAHLGLNIIRWRISIIDWCAFIIANLITLFMPKVAFGVHLAAFILGIATYITLTCLKRQNHKDR